MRPLRRLVGLVTLAAAAAGALVMVRRRFSHGRQRIDLYFADGSMSTHEQGSSQGERLLDLARQAVAIARTS